MKISVRGTTVLLGFAFLSTFAARVDAADAYTDPVGFYTLNIVGASDNVMSLPMVRDSVFSGAVGTGAISQNAFTAVAGTASPGWTASQYQYRDATQASPQPQTYYVEFTSGALKGLYYKVDNNGADTLTLDTEGDLLNAVHNISGNASGALAVGDTFKIRPYWRIKDIFESNGSPLIEPWPNALSAKDEILIPNYTSVGTNKAPILAVRYLAGQGWRASQGATDFSNLILRPTESFIVRRRNSANLAISNLGGVLMNKSVSYITGGNGTTGNDTYFSINRPAPVSLNNSGLHTADPATSVINESPNLLSIQDHLLAYDSTPGINRAPTAIYYYLAGQGWRQAQNGSTTIGDDVMLQPGKSYIIRKKANSAGRDWINEPNY